jgi:Fe-S oxidoreductase
VASANPGCSMHLAAVGVQVRHPMLLLAEALDEGTT